MTPVSTKRKRKVSAFKKFRRRVTYSDAFLSFAASVATGIFRAYIKTLRIEKDYHPEFLKIDRNKSILGFWHGRQFLAIPTFDSWGFVLMTDFSWAGEIQTRILKKFGYKIVRGSSKRKGAQALIQMKRSLEKGFPAGVALDGPRGPIYQSKPGALFLSKKLNIPILPVATSSNKHWILKNTWCDYLLPKPFSRCIVVLGEPIWPDEKLPSKAIDEIMNNWTKYADEKMGHGHQITSESE